MYRFVRYFIMTLMLVGPSLASAQQPSAGGVNSNPYNSPVKRANPNSRQGTTAPAPAVRGPGTVPTPRPPTLENGGIGNGYPTRQQAPVRPALEPQARPPARSTPSR